jgi:hypothetical protein
VYARTNPRDQATSRDDKHSIGYEEAQAITKLVAKYRQWKDNDRNQYRSEHAQQTEIVKATFFNWYEQVCCKLVRNCEVDFAFGAIGALLVDAGNGAR